MARIRKTQDAEGELLPPRGLVCVSAMLYDRLKRRIEKRLGKRLQMVTSAYLMDKYWNRSEKSMIIGMSPKVLSMAIMKKELEIAMTVFDVGRVYTTIWLHFPMSGQIDHVNEFLREIVSECKLTEQVEVNGGKLEMKFQLIDGDEPKLDPRPVPDRCGRKAYCCARELWKYEREQLMHFAERQYKAGLIAQEEWLQKERKK